MDSQIPPLDYTKSILHHDINANVQLYYLIIHGQTNGCSLYGSLLDGILGAELAKPIDWTKNYPVRPNLIFISMPFSFRAAVFNELLSAKN